MEIFGCGRRGYSYCIVWFSLLAAGLFATTGLALSSQEELQLGPLSSTRSLALPGNSLLELQCALHLLNILRNACGATTRIHFAEKRQASFGDDSITDLSDGCVTPLQVVSQACSPRPKDPLSGIFSVEGKRYSPSEFVAARGRRKGLSAVEEYPPGFLASRGRRSNGQQHQRERKEDGELSDLYVNGFIGTRG